MKNNVREVIVAINGEVVKMNVSRVFHWKSPRTACHDVGFMEIHTEKWVR